jgi:cytochrome c2
VSIVAEILVINGVVTARTPTVKRGFLDSQPYELATTECKFVVREPTTQQGGISRFESGYVLVTGDGDIHLFARPEDGRRLELQQLPIKAPLNVADFKAAMAGIPVAIEWFRVADVQAHSIPGGTRLFVSHHYWKSDDECFVKRVSVIEGSLAEFSAGSLQWRTLFETEPCLAVVQEGMAPFFMRVENGGRLSLFDDETLLLTVGDHAIDGRESGPAMAQLPDSSYGKIIQIDINDGSSRVLSRGHRNPQGLTVAPGGAIWATEHGPQGGDELNLIEDGNNYGWPYATHGVAYGTRVWPLTSSAGSHDGADYVQPFYSWIPSVAPSNLLFVESPKFEHWRGDLVIGTLKDRSLLRMRIRDERVVAIERIPVGDRIRDVVAGHQGELVLWTDMESILFIEPAPPSSAAAIRQIYHACAACHVPQAGAATAIGPDLKGVVGRRVGAMEGFAYSAAMRAHGGVWTRERLDAFLENPMLVVPGTTMTYTGIKEPGTRQQLIEYLTNPESDLGQVPEFDVK